MRTYRLLAVVLLAWPILALAQDKGVVKEDKKKAGESAPVVVVKGQLPRGWAKLGLTDKQKKEVYVLRGKYAVKRQALEEQIKALKEEEGKALDGLLTEAQRKRLAELKK